MSFIYFRVFHSRNLSIFLSILLFKHKSRHQITNYTLDQLTFSLIAFYMLHKRDSNSNLARINRLAPLITFIRVIFSLLPNKTAFESNKNKREREDLFSLIALIPTLRHMNISSHFSESLKENLREENFSWGKFSIKENCTRNIFIFI